MLPNNENENENENEISISLYKLENIIRTIQYKNIIPTIHLFNSILESLQFIEGEKFNLIKHIKKLFLNPIFSDIVPNKETFEILYSYIDKGYINSEDLINIRDIYSVYRYESIEITKERIPLSKLKRKLIENYLDKSS